MPAILIHVVRHVALKYLPICGYLILCFSTAECDGAQVGIGGSENFYSVFESELADHVPVIHASIAGCRIIGRLCVGNSKGLLLPNTTTDQEMLHIRNSLPDSVVVQVSQPILIAACLDVRY
uniref:Uncharacterized protein n=1 Tax=Guillardia theta TaxID=55529 RepID=A0A7S4NM54_GUITH|mmetsp:Transcript_24858/g.81809  ORF Transcript_24858/g.81809 Transcript_24858/m.81809 type:complete len:122 (+) Transcript_24858:410-775(+)